jgi:hypothetical protein
VLAVLPKELLIASFAALSEVIAGRRVFVTESFSAHTAIDRHASGTASYFIRQADGCDEAKIGAVSGDGPQGTGLGPRQLDHRGQEGLQVGARLRTVNDKLTVPGRTERSSVTMLGSRRLSFAPLYGQPHGLLCNRSVISHIHIHLPVKNVMACAGFPGTRVITMERAL